MMGHEVIWRIKDLEKLRRDLKLVYASARNSDLSAERVIQLFTKELELYPFQWPIQDEPEREEEWEWGKISVRYRRAPAEHLVEILEVKNADLHE